MLKIDNNLLVELGLGDLPELERKRLLGHIYETLELRVGTRLSEKMSSQQMEEFESFIDGDDVVAETYLARARANYKETEDFAKHQKSGGRLTEFAALVWLETNFPNYKDIVAEELDKLKLEIKQDAERIKEATTPSDQATV